MEEGTVNQDGNIIGRLGALALIVATLVGLGRVCGLTAAMCPIGSSKLCPFSAKEAPASEAPAVPAEAKPASPAPAKTPKK